MAKKKKKTGLAFLFGLVSDITYYLFLSQFVLVFSIYVSIFAITFQFESTTHIHILSICY